jgi:hypothetical protein
VVGTWGNETAIHYSGVLRIYFKLWGFRPGASGQGLQAGAMSCKKGDRQALKALLSPTNKPEKQSMDEW